MSAEAGESDEEGDAASDSGVERCEPEEEKSRDEEELSPTQELPGLGRSSAVLCKFFIFYTHIPVCIAHKCIV